MLSNHLAPASASSSSNACTDQADSGHMELWYSLRDDATATPCTLNAQQGLQARNGQAPSRLTALGLLQLMRPDDLSVRASLIQGNWVSLPGSHDLGIACNVRARDYNSKASLNSGQR